MPGPAEHRLGAHRGGAVACRRRPVPSASTAGSSATWSPTGGSRCSPDFSRCSRSSWLLGHRLVGVSRCRLRRREPRRLHRRSRGRPSSSAPAGPMCGRSSASASTASIPSRCAGGRISVPAVRCSARAVAHAEGAVESPERDPVLRRVPDPVVLSARTEPPFPSSESDSPPGWSRASSCSLPRSFTPSAPCSTVSSAMAIDVGIVWPLVRMACRPVPLDRLAHRLDIGSPSAACSVLPRASGSTICCRRA